MTETGPIPDLINSWDWGFGTIFGLPISFLFLFFLMAGVIWRLFGFPDFSFGWINLRNTRKLKTQSISFHKKLMLKLGLAEIKNVD